MKKRVALIGAAVLTLTLLGCGAQESDSAQPAGDAAVSAMQSMSMDWTMEAPRELTELEILTAYDRAVSAYSWFTRENMPCTGSAVEDHGVAVQRVQYGGISTLNELRTYLSGLFSKELVDQLMDEGESLYKEIDGALYVRPFQVEPAEETGTVSLSVEKTDESSYLVNVTVEILSADGKNVEGVECWAFPYEQVDGRWVFTSFDLAQ